MSNIGDDIWETTATLPANTTAWFMNVQNGETIASSGYQGDNAGTDISPYLNVNGRQWLNVDGVTVSQGDSIQLAPHPETGSSWRWQGPAGFSASDRTPSISDLQSAQAGDYIATYTDEDGNISRDTFTLMLSKSIN